jgi:hypothetical protein
MSQPNPFAAAAPAGPEPAPPAAPAPMANPYAQQAAPVQAYAPPAAVPAAPNPFGQAVPVAPAPQYGAPVQQQAPAQQWAQPVQQSNPAPPAPPQAFGQLQSAPAPVVGEGRGAKLADMYGRLVVIFPLAIDTVARNPQFITAEQRAQGNVTQDRLTATVVVLDQGPGTAPGGFIEWGGAPHQLGGAPHDKRDPLPYVRKGMWINQSRLISQCRPSVPAPGQPSSPVVGRLAKTGPEANAPWYLVGASDAEVQLAQTYLNLVAAGQYPHPLA